MCSLQDYLRQPEELSRWLVSEDRPSVEGPVVASSNGGGDHSTASPICALVLRAELRLNHMAPQRVGDRLGAMAAASEEEEAASGGGGVAAGQAAASCAPEALLQIQLRRIILRTQL